MKPPVHGTPRLMRAINDRAALRILLEKGPLTRPELSRLTGLSKPTAFQLLARLEEAGLVVHDGVRSGHPGRTAEVYRVNGAAAYVAALDVTPGRIGVRIADITGTIVGEADYRAPAPPAPSPPATALPSATTPPSSAASPTLSSATPSSGTPGNSATAPLAPPGDSPSATLGNPPAAPSSGTPAPISTDPTAAASAPPTDLISAPPALTPSDPSSASPALTPTTSTSDPAAGTGLVEQLRAAIEAAKPPGPLHRIVIGVQGAVDPTTGRLDYATAEDMPGWLIPDLEPTLTTGLGVTVDVENDVNLAALAEQAHGAAAGCPDFVLLWAGEGLGAALVIGGRLHRGFFGGAGEVGYMPIPGAATARDGGRFGHHGYQALAGGPALHDLLRSYGVRGADFRESVATAVRLAEGTGTTAQEAAAGLRTVAARVAVGLATIASVVDPGLIVLAGGLMSAGGERLRDLVERELRVLDVERPQVLLSAVQDNPVLVGALDLALARVRDEVFGQVTRDGTFATR